MSFSANVKEELAQKLPDARHCRIAETAAILSFCGKVAIDADDRCRVIVSTENASVARKYFTLLQKTFNIKTDIIRRQNPYLRRSPVYLVTVAQDESARRLLLGTKLMRNDGQVEEDISAVRSLVIQNSCCKRAFLRGAFLAAGSISDPERFYHFEIACLTQEKADRIREVIAAFDIEARIVARKKYYVVYVKDGSRISDLLNVMEAPQAMMEFENIRIMREMRGSVNRKVNCETANIQKTVSAAVKQIDDITLIRDLMGFGGLPESLAQIARLRLEKPEATLTELGESLDPPVGKSGVNHRLRKLSNLAEDLREKCGSERPENRPEK